MNDRRPEIVVINSQSLQDEVNSKLPSQRGFGSELMATNVITPIIDLTEATGGGAVATDLLRAVSFGSQTAFNIDSTTTVIANTVGFFRIFGVVNVFTSSSTSFASFSLTDGVSIKTILKFQSGLAIPSYDFVVFLGAGSRS